MNAEPVGIYGPQPTNRTDDGVPHERTGLAWQRTGTASNDSLFRDPHRSAAAVPQVALTRVVGFSTTGLALLSLVTALALTLR
jgi:hypothetical protein